MMIACTAGAPMDELSFARAAHRRTDWVCIGELVTVALHPISAAHVIDAMQSQVARDLLWSGYLDDTEDAMRFRLCAVHWTDLAAVVGQRAAKIDNEVWYDEACNLLDVLCMCCGWDLKELSNMFASQRVRLT